jgi:hypothetical protein
MISGINNGKSNAEILKINRGETRKQRKRGLSNQFILLPKNINSTRYYRNKLECGTFSESFDIVLGKFYNGKYRYLKLYDHDPVNLSLSMFVKHDELKRIKSIFQFYLYGTFKTRWWRGSHYNILVFALNLPGSLRTIPLAITISFKNTGDVWLEMWNRIIQLLRKLDVRTGLCSLISEMGSGELKFVRSIQKFYKHVFCWFHVMNKAFIPKLKSLYPRFRRDEVSYFKLIN